MKLVYTCIRLIRELSRHFKANHFMYELYLLLSPSTSSHPHDYCTILMCRKVCIIIKLLLLLPNGAVSFDIKRGALGGPVSIFGDAVTISAVRIRMQVLRLVFGLKLENKSFIDSSLLSRCLCKVVGRERLTPHESMKVCPDKCVILFSS